MKSINSREAGQIVLSIVVPVYNEEKVIGTFYDRTTKVMQTLSLPYEIIFVNDGSRDLTLPKLIELQTGDSHLKIVDLSRNFGQEIAQTAGIDYASGEAIIIIHADLQDPPEVIPEFVKQWKEGYDVVYGIRTKRDEETWFKKVSAILYGKILQRVTHIHIPANVGEFQLLNRRAIEAVKQMPERHRFMRGLFAWVGFKQTGVPYRREQRFTGKSKMNFWRLWNFALEGITSFSSFPLRIAAYVGAIVLLLSLGYAGFTIFKEFAWDEPVRGYSSIVVAIFFLGGVQLITLGIIGEYLWKIYMETKRRPLYFVKQLFGFGEERDLRPDAESHQSSC